MPAIEKEPKESSTSSPVVVVNDEPELPPLTLKNVLTDIVVGIAKLFYDPEVGRAIGPLLLIGELILLKLIIIKIPYTEIDYATYMQQIELVKDGELNYNNIKGDTGPIVYPAGFVYIYKFMNFMSDGIDNIDGGQWVVKYVYLACFLFTIISYYQASIDKIRPFFFYMLVASKRLHSIFVLRLFNDSFTTYFMLFAIVLLQYSAYTKKLLPSLSPFLLYGASFTYSLGLSVKMNALLYLPGFLIISYFLLDENLLKVIFGPIITMLIVQIGVAYKFLGLGDFYSEESIINRSAYLKNAFDFNRKFLYEWTVNWKFLDEEIFQSDEFHKLLLLLHVGTLIFFSLTFWLTPKVTGKSVSQLLKDGLKFWESTINPQNIIFNEEESSKYVLIVMSLSNLIGVLFSRSLHYQFLSWYSFTFPYLLYSSNLPFYITIPLFSAHEWCWNVFPATPLSSGVLVSILSIVIIANWFQKFDPKPIIEEEKKDQ